MKLPGKFPVQIKRGNVTLKIYRTSNKGYDEFKLVYYGADGNRKFKTFAEYQDAKSEAEKVNASFSTGNADTLVLSSREAAALPQGCGHTSTDEHLHRSGSGRICADAEDSRWFIAH